MKRILLVEDNRELLQALTSVITESGYTVFGCFSAGDALKAAQEEQFDLVILDIFLSGGDGRTLTKALRSQSVYRTVPIIAMSAVPTAKQSALQSGADAFLVKPFDIVEFADLIAKYVEPGNHSEVSRIVYPNPRTV